MKWPVLIVCFVFIPGVQFAQLTSTEIRDAAATGPFPFYVGIGYANSFKPYKDFTEVNRAFSNYLGNEDSRNKRLFGVQALLGVNIMPEDANWPVSLVSELRLLYLRRLQTTNGQSFSMNSTQSSLLVGARYAIFPVSIHILGGPVLTHTRDFKFRGMNKSIRFGNDSKPFDDWQVLFKLNLLDPAGTEGGFGAFFEWGWNFIRENDRDLAPVIRAFDQDYTETMPSRARYGYFSAGVIVPLAFRIR